MEIKAITLKINIIYANDEVKKYNWKITGFLHRKLKIVHNGKLSIRTATQIRDWFMRVLQEGK